MGGQSGFNSMNMDDIFSQFGDIFGGGFGGFAGASGWLRLQAAGTQENTIEELKKRQKRFLNPMQHLFV